MEIRINEEEVASIMADAASLDTEKVIAAFKRLGAFRYAPAVHLLNCRSSGDPEATIRLVCAQEAEEILGPAAVPLLEGCLRDRVIEIGMEAAGALARIGTDAAARAILRAINRGNQVLNTHALYALGFWSSKAGVPAILETLKGPDPIYPQELALALARCGAREHLPLIEMFYNYSQEEELRIKYAAALTMLGRDMRGDILQGLESHLAEVKLAALSCVRELQDKSFFLDIVPLLTHHASAVAEDAAATLEMLGLTKKEWSALSRKDRAKIEIRKHLYGNFKLEAED